MLHIIVLAVIKENPIACGLPDVRPSFGTGTEVTIRKGDGTGFTLLVHIFSASVRRKGRRLTDLLIISFEFFQDMFACLGIVNQGISLRPVNELEVSRSWLTEYRLWRHFLWLTV
jgi:hypothetical protein